MKEIEDYLEVAKDQGFTGAHLWHSGGGIMLVWIPLKHPVYEYALLDYIGLGLYAHGWDGDDVPMFLFDDDQDHPTYVQALDAFEWMSKSLETGAK
jgi:hypothetical protein